MDCWCEETRCAFSEERERQARKEYGCEECRGQIKPGERYFEWRGKVVSLWDEPRFGKVLTFRMCLQCKADWEAIYEILPTELICACYGELLRNVQEAFDLGFVETNHPLVQRWLELEPEPNVYQLAEAAGQLAFPWSAGGTTSFFS